MFESFCAHLDHRDFLRSWHDHIRLRAELSAIGDNFWSTALSHSRNLLELLLPLHIEDMPDSFFDYKTIRAIQQEEDLFHSSYFQLGMRSLEQTLCYPTMERFLEEETPAKKINIIAKELKKISVIWREEALNSVLGSTRMPAPYVSAPFTVLGEGFHHKSAYPCIAENTSRVTTDSNVSKVWENILVDLGKKFLFQKW
ncbi:MAG: hypothetical protein OXC30_04675 [Alphaproteobacteria bacterium]|nr:hypothetical protein [Alphaproteobacteria bacterium]